MRICLAWRVGVPLYASESKFRTLLTFIRQHHAAIDEIVFFETVTHHQYIPLAELKQRAALLARRMCAIRRTGIARTGINVLTTIGHRDEVWDFTPTLPFQPMVGHTGRISRSCACPNSSAFRQYVREKYTLIAQAAPDFIWVDDDLRLQGHGVGWSCFCPLCLRLFATACGKRYTRSALVTALASPHATKLRQLWVTHNATVLANLLQDIRAAINAVNPSIQTGLMTAGPASFLDGNDYAQWTTALRASKIRPGIGFYSDERPIAMFEKTLQVGRQIDGLPSSVTDIQYEMENFPYQPLDKSLTAVINECTLGFMAGCNGVLFNALVLGGDPHLTCRKPLLQAVAAARPFWEKLNSYLHGTNAIGFWPAWQPYQASRIRVRKNENWFDCFSEKYNPGNPAILGRLGVPLAPTRPGNCTILVGRLAGALTHTELRRIFSGGVLIDVMALEELERLGMADWTGVKIARRFNNGVMECLTNDPLNGPYAGYIRDVRIEWQHRGGIAVQLHPVAHGVRTLAVLETYFSRKLGACITAFKNRLGGRVVVLGYAPWNHQGCDAKRIQFQNIADWLSHNTIPLRIRSTAPIILLARLTHDHCCGAILLLNASLDTAKQTTVILRTPRVPAWFAAPGKRIRPLSPRREPDGWSVTFKQLEPWQVGAILLGHPTAR